MLSVAVPALLGAFTWTLLEYVIHRWMGHDRRLRKTPFGKEHVRHHVEGDYFAPTSKKVLVAAAVAVTITPAAIAIAHVAAGVSYVAGLLGLYASYELLHRREHTHAPFGPYGRWARAHHFHHHFVDGRTNHGVTSPIWDLVFGTYARPGVIAVPSRLCMAWLRDPRTGDVRAEHADTFVLPARRDDGA